MAKKEATPNKFLSIAFWMAIPAYFFLGAVCFIAFIVLFDKFLSDSRIWALFAFGIISSLAVIGGSEIGRLRVFIHETKHALAVLLTGSSLKEFRVGSDEGAVEYEISPDRLHLAPMIVLAPYCLPLLSFPALLAGIIFEADYREYCTLGLGLALGADIALSWSELAPRQTDFKQIAGGFFASGIFLAGFLFFWVSACLLWVLAGRMGFVYAGYVALRVVHLGGLKFGILKRV